jgi:hypothetical protein
MKKAFVMKNKVKLASVIWFGVLLFAGCHKNEGGCKHPSPDYPPNGVEVSWTSYNTVKQLKDYFNCHKMAIMNHFYDTIMLTGYAYYPDYSNLEPDPEEWYWNRGLVYLVDNKNHHGYNNGIAYVIWNVDDSSFVSRNRAFRDDFELFREKKWYVTAIIRSCVMMDGTCCVYIPEYTIVDVDIVPKSLDL